MRNSLTLKAYAKINLHLDVTGRLENGYHTISSIMQQVSLFDEITVAKAAAAESEQTIRITCTEPSIPTDGKNIVHKCACRFFEHFGISSYCISIHIDKRIPHAAGLAGGSTDGAAVLKILPKLFDVSADTDTLCRIGARIGADIPFCIVGGTCLAEGIGEKLTPLHRNFTCPVLLAIGGEGISTPEAYNRIDQMYVSRFKTPDASCVTKNCMAFLSAPHVPTTLYNIFESVILPTHPQAREIKDAMIHSGARSALMSGSGPSVFGLFDSAEQRDLALEAFRKQGIRAFPCEFVDIPSRSAL